MIYFKDEIANYYNVSIIRESWTKIEKNISIINGDIVYLIMIIMTKKYCNSYSY